MRGWLFVDTHMLELFDWDKTLLKRIGAKENCRLLISIGFTQNSLGSDKLTSQLRVLIFIISFWYLYTWIK